MTNEEIIEEYGKPENWISLSDLLDLARQDEREKMQGVEVWVSVDKVDAVISTDEPEKYEQDGANFFCNYGYAIGVNVQDFANFLGVERGQCKRVRIVEVLP